MHIDDTETVNAILVNGFWYNVAADSFRSNGEGYCDKTDRWCDVYRLHYRRDSRRFESEIITLEVLGDMIEAVQYAGDVR